MTTKTPVVERADDARPDSTPDVRRPLHADALACNIATRLGACSHDELRVIDVILGRLEKGRADYGPLELDGDPRNWRDEAAEELVDLAIYDACDRLSRRDARLKKLRADAAAEIATLACECGCADHAAYCPARTTSPARSSLRTPERAHDWPGVVELIPPARPDSAGAHPQGIAAERVGAFCSTCGCSPCVGMTCARCRSCRVTAIGHDPLRYDCLVCGHREAP